MDFIITTIGLGIIAKLIELKLEKHTRFEKEWIPMDEIEVKQEEKLAYEVYS